MLTELSSGQIFGDDSYHAASTCGKYDESIDPEAVEFTGDVSHDELNPDFWKSNELDPEIRMHMVKIAKAFFEYLKLDAKLVDIIFTGSLANYNWTSKSDVDIHLTLKYPTNEDEEFINEYINAKKQIWNTGHNITIKGFSVELFAKNNEKMFKSKGIYSVAKDKWVQEPDKDNKDIDVQTIKEKSADLINRIDSLDDIIDNDKRMEELTKIKERLKGMRDAGLERAGEFSIENLVFKTLRKNGYLEKLGNISMNTTDTMLSMKEGEENIDKDLCPACGEKYVSQCKCGGPIKHNLDALKNGHGLVCPNKHRWSYNTKDGKVVVLNNLNEAEQSILKKNIAKIEKPEKIKEPEKIDKIEKIEKIAKIEKIKKEDTDYDFGCLMVSVPIKNWDDVLSLIDPEDVYDEPGYGLESEPHITVLYGFHDEVKAEDTKDRIKEELPGFSKVNIKLTSIDHFSSKEYDVVKFDVQSKDLDKLNKILNEFPHTSEFHSYEPHMTIAYVKKGRGIKYDKPLKKKPEFCGYEFVFSYASGEKESFKIKKPKNTLGVEVGLEIEPKKLEYIKKFINFTCNKLGMEEPVNVFLHKGRDEFISTTASYCPSDNSNHLRVENRALVDVLRSAAHEITHNRQREIKSFSIDEEVQNIGGWIEDEANAKAGVLIKDFAITYGNNEIYDL